MCIGIVCVHMYACICLFTYSFLAYEAPIAPSSGHNNASSPCSSFDLSGVDSMVTCRDKHVINAWEYLKNVGNSLIGHVHFPESILQYSLMLYKGVKYGCSLQHCFNRKKNWKEPKGPSRRKYSDALQ